MSCRHAAPCLHTIKHNNTPHTHQACTHACTLAPLLPAVTWHDEEVYGEPPLPSQHALTSALQQWTQALGLKKQGNDAFSSKRCVGMRVGWGMRTGLGEEQGVYAQCSTVQWADGEYSGGKDWIPCVVNPFILINIASIHLTYTQLGLNRKTTHSTPSPTHPTPTLTHQVHSSCTHTVQPHPHPHPQVHSSCTALHRGPVSMCHWGLPLLCGSAAQQPCCCLPWVW